MHATTTVEVRLGGLPSPRGTSWTVRAGSTRGRPGEALPVMPGTVAVELLGVAVGRYGRIEFSLRFQTNVQRGTALVMTVPSRRWKAGLHRGEHR